MSNYSFSFLDYFKQWAAVNVKVHEHYKHLHHQDQVHLQKNLISQRLIPYANENGENEII